MLAGEFEEKFIKPIINASYPGTLAGLGLAAIQVARIGGDPYGLRIILSFGAMMFLFSAFLIFFYSIYPTRKKLWTGTAITFLIGLFCSVLSAFVVLLA